MLPSQVKKIRSSDAHPQVCSSAIDDYFHREAIKKVEWVRAAPDGLTVDSGAEEYQLASVSGDGKVQRQFLRDIRDGASRSGRATWWDPVC